MKFLSKIRFFLFLFVFLPLLTTAIYFIFNIFLVKNIHIASGKIFSLANKDLFINRSLLFMNQNELATQIILENPSIKTAVVSKVWPSSIKISVSFYEPCGLLVVSRGYFSLSCDGRILQKVSNIQPFLPIINYYQKLNTSNFKIGDWIQFKDIKQVLFYAEKLKEINLVPLTIDIKGQDMLVFKLINDKAIIFSISKDEKVQFYQLEMIVKKFKIEGKEFRKIDLRFNKPVIEF